MDERNEEVWYVLLQGEELGPMSFDEILDFYYKDVVTSESLLWREGWTDWVSIVQIPEFNELLFQGAIISPSQEDEISTIGEDTAFISEEQLRQAVMYGGSDESEAEDISLDGEFYDLEELEELEELEDYIDAGAQPPELQSTGSLPTQALSGSYQATYTQGSSQSVLAVDPNQPRQNAHRPALAIPLRSTRKSRLPRLLGGLILLGGLTWGGLVFYQPLISPPQPSTDPSLRLSSLPPPGSEPEVGSTIDYVSSDQVLPTPRLPSGVSLEQSVSDSPPTISNRPITTASIAKAPDAGLIEPSNDPETAEAKPPQSTNSSPLAKGSNELQPPAALDSPLDTSSPGTPEATPHLKSQQGKPLSGTAPRSTPRSTPTLKTITTKKTAPPPPNRKPTSRKPTNRPPPKATPKPANNRTSKSSKTLPLTLTRKDFNRVILHNQPKLKKCTQKDPTLKTTVILQVTIQRDGAVSQVRPISYKLRKSPAKDCILTAAKGFRFPSYSGDLLRTNLPIKL